MLKWMKSIDWQCFHHQRRYSILAQVLHSIPSMLPEQVHRSVPPETLVLDSEATIPAQFYVETWNWQFVLKLRRFLVLCKDSELLQITGSSFLGVIQEQELSALLNFVSVLVLKEFKMIHRFTLARSFWFPPLPEEAIFQFGWFLKSPVMA